MHEQLTNLMGQSFFLTYCDVNLDLELLELSKSKIMCTILFYDLDDIHIDVKIREAIIKAWNWVMNAILSIKFRKNTIQ